MFAVTETTSVWYMSRCCTWLYSLNSECNYCILPCQKLINVSTVPSGSEPLYYRSFIVTLTQSPHTRWDSPESQIGPTHRPYLTTHSTHNRQTSTSAGWLDPATPPREGQQTHTLDRAVTELGLMCVCLYVYIYISIIKMFIVTEY